MVCLSESMAVEGLKVHSSPWFARLFGSNDHFAAPCDRSANRHWFQDAQTYIPIKVRLDLILPVDWDRDWGVVCGRLGFWVYHEAKGRARHHMGSG